MTCADCQRYLSVYVDGELDARTAADIEEHARPETCAACARALESRQALSQLLREQAPRFTAPAGLEDRLARALRRAPGARRRWSPAATAGTSALAGAAVAAALMLAVGPPRRHAADGDARTGESAASTQSTAESTTVMAELVGAHLRSLQADHLLDIASSDRHTVKPWFQGRVDFTVTPTDLTAHGFVLAGGRADYVAGHPTAAIVYRKDQHIMNVLCQPAAVAAPARDGSWRGFSLASFKRGDVACTVVADSAATEVQRLRDLLAAAK